MTAHDAPTRGALLTLAEERISAAETVLVSARRCLPVLWWSIGLALLTIVQFSADLDADVASYPFLVGLAVVWWVVARLVPGRAVLGHVAAAFVVVIAGAVLLPLVEDLGDDAARTLFWAAWAATAVGVGWTTWIYVATSRRLLGEVETWVSARRDPARGTLDDADVPLELATVHDVRDRADFDDVVGAVVGRHTGRLYSLRIMKPTVVLMITGIAGLVFLLAPVVGLDDSGRAVATGVSGLLLLAPWAWAAVADMGGLLVGRQEEANRVGVESRLYAVRRRHTAGVTSAPARRPSLLGSPVGLFLLLAWVIVLLIRIRTSSPLAIVVALAIVLVATVVVVVRVVRRRAHLRVYPLQGVGDSVLQSPSRRVSLTLTDTGLEITDADGHARPHTIALADIVAVEPVDGTAAFRGGALGIVTTGSPVVIAGRDLDQDPAVVELRRRLASRAAQ